MGLSVWHLLIVLLVVVLMFGTNRLPTLMGDLAKGVKAFKGGLRDEAADGQARGQDGAPAKHG
jgi:sec-independent protein translocase protein TatA